jgi:hypothetical protein
VVLYDPQPRSALQTSQPFPSRNNKRDKLITNADGSIDLYFGPEAPAGKEANWVQTVPGKGWFTIFRLYAPLDAWFDKTWKPGEMERVKWSRERATERTMNRKRPSPRAAFSLAHIGSTTSVIGTSEKCRPSVTASAFGGKPEVIDGEPNRRD